MKKTGTFYYMSTRNNNFSNRSQKGTMIIVPVLAAWAIALIVVGSFVFVVAGVVGGSFIYARYHPHSRVAGVFDTVGRKLRSLRRRGN